MVPGRSWAGVPLEINGVKSVLMMTHPATSDSTLWRKLSVGALYTIGSATVQFLISHLFMFIERPAWRIEFETLSSQLSTGTSLVVVSEMLMEAERSLRPCYCCFVRNPACRSCRMRGHRR